jgi:hypothetical protein
MPAMRAERSSPVAADILVRMLIGDSVKVKFVYQFVEILSSVIPGREARARNDGDVVIAAATPLRYG